MIRGSVSNSRPAPSIHPVPLGYDGAVAESRRVPRGQAIDEILLVAERIPEGEWEGQVRYLPLR